MNETDTALFATAFGEDPSRWPLPPPLSPEQLWLRSVAAGGQGRYSAARADLIALHRLQPSERLVSLAYSTYASFLRQLGWHDLARGWDGRALAVVGPIRDAEEVEARSDALVGLAADALGIGRLAASAAFLAEARKASVATGGPPRLSIRLEWVSAELAMAAGDGKSALRHAERGVELAELTDQPMRRHQVKSNVVLAAALCCAGSLEKSRLVADSTLADATQYGLVPLRWALASLLGGIGSNMYSPQVVGEIRATSADFVTRHGGQWSGR